MKYGSTTKGAKRRRSRLECLFIGCRCCSSSIEMPCISPSSSVTCFLFNLCFSVLYRTLLFPPVSPILLGDKFVHAKIDLQSFVIGFSNFAWFRGSSLASFLHSPRIDEISSIPCGTCIGRYSYC